MEYHQCVVQHLLVKRSSFKFGNFCKLLLFSFLWAFNPAKPRKIVLGPDKLAQQEYSLTQQKKQLSYFGGRARAVVSKWGSLGSKAPPTGADLRRCLHSSNCQNRALKRNFIYPKFSHYWHCICNFIVNNTVAESTDETDARDADPCCNARSMVLRWNSWVQQNQERFSSAIVLSEHTR